MVVRALLISRLDLCNALYVGLPLKTAWKVQVQLVQNAAARLITGVHCLEHMTPILHLLYGPLIHFQPQFKVLALTALNDLGPG